MTRQYSCLSCGEAAIIADSRESDKSFPLPLTKRNRGLSEEDSEVADGETELGSCTHLPFTRAVWVPLKDSRRSSNWIRSSPLEGRRRPRDTCNLQSKSARHERLPCLPPSMLP